MSVPDDILLKLARLAIAEVFSGDTLIDRQKWISRYPELAEKQAVFVTLYIRKGENDESLRGCIGSILPARSLIDDVIYNARAAAFNDPRFSSLTPEEFEQVNIEVSLLSLPVKLNYKDIDDLKQKIIPQRHGVILKLSGRQATFLPQVWQQLPRFEIFFKHLCNKARLPDNCLQYHPDIYVYTVKEIKEK